MGEYKPTLGLALGAGSARGLAHLGVLKTLSNSQINIDMIAGTSIGSIFGGLYACGLPLKYLEGLLEEIYFKDITDISFSRKGLIKGRKLLRLLEILTQQKTFAETNLPFAAVACDIETGDKVILKEGSLAGAMRASSSIPGIYHPFHHQEKLLVDGAVIDRIPVDTCRKMGAEIVVAVDVGIRKINKKAENMFDVLLNTFDIMQSQIEEMRVLNADIVIRPRLQNVSSFDLERSQECIEAGSEAARHHLDDIKEILKDKERI